MDWQTPSAPTEQVDGRLLNRFRQAVEASDAKGLRQLLESHSQLAAALDAPLFSFDKPAIVEAAAKGSIPTLEALLDHGADIDRQSSWQAGGFGVLHSTCFDHPEVARWLIDRGAAVDVHAAAGLGDLGRLEELLRADATCLQHRGPDGQLALHFAADIATAQWLLDHGAELNTGCIDHRSTAAQWAIARAPELSRFLLAQGAEADIFLAVALDDEALVRRLIDQDPQCLRARLGRPGYGPVQPGNILQWNLGWWATGGRASPHRVARAKGSEAMYQLLWRHSPADVRFMVAAWHGDKAAAQAALDEQPDLVAQLPSEDQRFLADAAWDGNTAAVEILLDSGFDPHIRGDHASTPLDRAAFHGFADVIALLLEHDDEPPLEERNEFGGRPLGALLYGCHHGWRDDGDTAEAARLLAAAGCVVHPHDVGMAPDEVAAALRPFVEDIGRSRSHPWDAPPLDGAVDGTASGTLSILLAPSPNASHHHEIHGSDPPGPWIWYYETTVRNHSAVDLELLWMDAFVYEGGAWRPNNGRGRALTPGEIDELFTDGDSRPAATLPTGAVMVRPVAWLLGDGPIRSMVKWAMVARDAAGQEYWAEARLDPVPYGLEVST